MTKTVCDICGKDMPTERSCDVSDIHIQSNGRLWDICNKCRDDLNSWIKLQKAELYIPTEKIIKKEEMTEKENAIYELEKMATWCDPYTLDELRAINYARKILHSKYVIIPNNVTYGDVIRILFPKAKVREENVFKNCMRVTVQFSEQTYYFDIHKELWNAPYKREEGNNERREN